MTTKLPVQRDTDMEKLTTLTFEACAAYYAADKVRVVGGVVSSNLRPIQDYREVQVSVYDKDGDILGRNYINWSEFGIRQSFEIEVEKLPGAPDKVKVFPSK